MVWNDFYVAFFETDKLLNGIPRIYQVNIRQASNQTENPTSSILQKMSLFE